MRQISNISFQQIDQCPRLIKDYLVGHLSHLQAYPAHVHQAFDLAQKTKFSAENRALLHDVLRKQHPQASALQAQNMASLLQNDSFTVCTGHQLNLGLGPVFSIYKILQVIKTCQQLNQEKKQHFVPVFWMASEDHDFEEISFFSTEQQKYSTQIPEQKTAVGRLLVEDNAFLDDLKKELQGFPFANELMQMLAEAYQSKNNFAQATRSLLQRLFADFGLLILDADDAQLKSLMKEEFKTEIIHQNLIKKTKKSCEFIQQNYGKLQVNPREINLFYLKETRNRLVKNADLYEVLDTDIKFTEAEILAEIEAHPECFSPNAIFRPLYQQKILPNAIYIGGNAEIMYWLQLKDWFEDQNVAFPVLLPRNSLIFLEAKEVEKQSQLPLNYVDYFEGFEAHQQKILSEDNPIYEALQESKLALTRNINQLKALKNHSLVSFEQMILAEEKRQQNSIHRLEKRWLKAEKIKQKEMLERLQAMQNKLNPKIWQERKLNFVEFYKFYGPDWLQYCYNLLEIENSTLIIAQNS